MERDSKWSGISWEDWGCRRIMHMCIGCSAWKIYGISVKYMVVGHEDCLFDFLEV